MREIGKILAICCMIIPIIMMTLIGIHYYNDHTEMVEDTVSGHDIRVGMTTNYYLIISGKHFEVNKEGYYNTIPGDEVIIYKSGRVELIKESELI